MTSSKTAEARNNLVTLLERAEVYRHDFLRVVKATLRYRLADGRMSEPVTRFAVNHGDAVGVLLYQPSEDTVLLVRQFRYPIYDRPEMQNNADPSDAWLLEIVAGIQEQGQSAEETARRELAEETGYEITGGLEPIVTVYASPGSSTERLALFLAEIDKRTPKRSGGGLASEGEDTELIPLSLRTALDMVASGKIRDAKTVIALQHLALRKGRIC